MGWRSLGVLALAAGLTGACGDAGGGQAAPPPMQPQQQPQQPPAGFGGFPVDSTAPPPNAPPISGQPPVGPSAPAGPGGETLISGQGSAPPPEFQALITGYLDNYAQQMAQGWPRAGGVPDIVTGLNVNGEHVAQVQLRAGQPYAFVGACDNECSDVDLVLQDASGRQVAADQMADDYPLVEVTPPTDGAYTLRIRLKACSIAPCYVGARLLRRP